MKGRRRTLILVTIVVIIVCCQLMITNHTTTTTQSPDELCLYSCPDKPCKSSCNLIRTSSTLESDNSATSTVITIWQQHQLFTFKHFLTLLSVTKVLQADLIWFLYCSYPITDDYNQWLQLITQQFPFIRFEKCRDCCLMKKIKDTWLIAMLTRKGGGTYIAYDVIVTKMAEDFYTRNGFTIFDEQRNVQILMLKPSLVPFMYQRVRTGPSYFFNDSVAHQVGFTPNTTCHTIEHFNNDTVSSPAQCYDLKRVNSDDIYPSDIWFCQSTLCADVRYLMYSSRRVITPMKSDKPAPNIVHYIWFGKNTDITYTFYLSVLSFVFIGGFKQIYLHCDNVPSGEKWNELKQQLIGRDSKMTVVYRVNPNTVYNQTVLTVQHMADVIKADIAFKYGGVIVDIDVLLVKPLNEQFFSYDFVVGKDVGKHGNFPDIVNMGIIISQPKSQFSQIWMKSMQIFRDSDWLWNAGMATYKLIEYNPSLVHIETHLQVICYNYKFHPTWTPKQYYQNLNHTFQGYSTLEEWIDQTYSFHFTNPEYFHNRAYLKQEKNLVEKIGWYVESKTMVGASH